MIYRGILKAWDSSTYLADVQMIGTMSKWLGSIAVNRSIEDADMVTGRYVAVWFPEPGNPAEAVVLAVYT